MATDPTRCTAPWPCWMLAASPSADEQQVKDFLSALGDYTTEFDSKDKRETENVAYVAKTFGQQESDVKEWLSTVAWYHDLAKVESKVVLDTLQYVTDLPDSRHFSSLTPCFVHQDPRTSRSGQETHERLERFRLRQRKGRLDCVKIICVMRHDYRNNKVLLVIQTVTSCIAYEPKRLYLREGREGKAISLLSD